LKLLHVAFTFLFSIFENYIQKHKTLAVNQNDINNHQTSILPNIYKQMTSFHFEVKKKERKRCPCPRGSVWQWGMVMGRLLCF
jgi:hypothetical protein